MVVIVKRLKGHALRVIIFFLYCLISFCYLNAFSQEKISKKYKKIIHSAILNIGQSKYVVAEKEINQVIQNNPNFLQSYLILADMYNKMKKYSKAIEVYSKAKQIDSYQTHFLYLPIAINYSGLGKFDSALHYLYQYKALTKGKKFNLKKFNQLEKNFLFAISYHEKNKNQIDNYDFRIHNLGDSINTSISEYFPSLNFDNNKMIFTRRIKGVYVDLENPYLSEEEREILYLQQQRARNIENEDFFESRMIDRKWTRAKPLEGELNGNTNEGGSNLSVDGKYLYFTGCNFPDSKGSCDIYVSEYKDGKWSKPKNFSDDINTEFWESQPSISTDGKTLYFSSRRPGGFGGADLYVSYKKNKKRWTKPVNLGPQFNTPGDEISPFIHPDNRTLYFASNHLDGYGGFDLFKTFKIGKNRWKKPKNLGYPINSVENESNIFISSNGHTALFSSDKGDSKGKVDIFQFELRKDLRPLVTVMVKKRLLINDNIPVQRAEIKLYDVDDMLLISEPEVDTEGYFTLTVGKEKKYMLNINGQDIFYQFDTIDAKKDITILQKDSVVQVKKITKGAKMYIENIYFETDSFTLKTTSFFELNSLAEMLRVNPNVVIKITGHTDSTGSEQYNQTLSEKRAYSVKNYLIKKGVSSRRLICSGVGFRLPVASNTLKRGRALNRRIEIEILQPQNN